MTLTVSHVKSMMSDMSEVVRLLERLRDLEPATQLTQHLYRLSAPSPLAFQGSFVAVDAIPGAAAQPLGSYPMPVSILRWFDLSEQTNFVRDQEIATQLGALLTLTTNRRIAVASSEQTTRMHASPYMNFIPTNADDTELVGPIAVDVKAELNEVSSALSGLDEGALESVMRAVELHYSAAQLFDTDINTATTLVVAGIETLANRFEESTTTWTDFSDAGRFDSLFEDLGLSEIQRQRLRDALLDGQHLRLTQRFTSYVMRMLPDSFWDAPVGRFVPSLTMTAQAGAEFMGYTPADPIPMENFVPRDPGELRRRLNSTYAARSRFIHAGRKAHGPMTILSAAAGRNDAKSPLPFAGLRRILRSVILRQIATSSDPKPLPDFTVYSGEGLNSGKNPDDQTD